VVDDWWSRIGVHAPIEGSIGSPTAEWVTGVDETRVERCFDRSMGGPDRGIGDSGAPKQ